MEIPHVDEEQLLTQWRQLEARVMQMVQKAQGDPEYRTSLGLQAQASTIDIMSGRVAGPETQSPQAELLRGCAAKVIPKHFEWDVVSTVGGAAFLVLKGVRTGNE